MVVAAAMVVVIGGSLSGCGVQRAETSAHGAVDGLVTGTAAPCDGPAMDNADLPATVTIKGAAATATQTVRGDHVYRLEVPAGNYRIWSNASSATVIVVSGGHVAHVDLPDLCR
jgi:hypothetical protein